MIWKILAKAFLNSLAPEAVPIYIIAHTASHNQVLDTSMQDRIRLLVVAMTPDRMGD
jgi:hypothetical protein